MHFSSTEWHHIDGCRDDVGTFIQQEFNNAQNNPHAGLVGCCQYACTHWSAGERAGSRISSSCDPVPPRRSWLQVFPLVLARTRRPSSMSAVDNDATGAAGCAAPWGCPPRHFLDAKQSHGGNLLHHCAELRAAAWGPPR